MGDGIQEQPSLNPITTTTTITAGPAPAPAETAEPYFPPPPTTTSEKHHSSDLTIANVSLSDASFHGQMRPQDLQRHAWWRIVDGVRTGLALVALAASVVVLGVSAQALYVYNETHVAPDMLLPLWPDEFDVRPTQALVGCSAVVLVFSAISLFAPSHLRSRPLFYKTISFGAPVAAFIAAIVAMSFFYGVNASSSVHTVQSWSCRWRRVAMDQAPHFGTLCEQTRAGIALAVLLVPLEAVLVAVSGYQVILEGKLAGEVQRRKLSGTPVGGNA